MKRLRIIHVLHRMGAGGTELALRRVVAGLDPESFENIICTVAPIPEAERTAGARYISLERSGRKTGSLVADLARVFLRERPDVVHSRNWGAIEAVVAAKLARVPRIIHSEHGRDINTMNGDPLRRRMFRRFCYTLADEVFAVSRELREHYAAQVGVPVSKFGLIPNGVDTGRFQPNPEVRTSLRERLKIANDVVLAGTVGRLDPVKDHATFVEAAEQLVTSGARLHFVIVGGGPEHDALRSRIDSSPALRKRFILAGEAERPEDWLNAFDIFVLPSLSEGMSNTVLEAMATALPCVVTAVGANPDLVEDGHTGFLVEARDADTLADRMLELAADPQLRSTFGRRGRLKVETQFSLPRMIANYTRLYTTHATHRRAGRTSLSRARGHQWQ
ncbi:MAG: glycosyltransferase [Terriglobales bacterium]